VAGGGDAAALVVADVMDHEIAAEVLDELRAGDHVGATEVVAHDLHAVVAAGLDDALEGFLVGAGHDDDVGRAGLGHHLGLEVAAVHRLQVSDDWDLREALAQGAHAVQPLGEDERRAGLEPVHARPAGHGRGVEGLLDVGEVQGDLYDGAHGEIMYMSPDPRGVNADAWSIGRTGKSPAAGPINAKGRFSIGGPARSADTKPANARSKRDAVPP